MLRVSPCAIILEESGIAASPLKLRLIMGLPRGGVKERLPAWEVEHGSGELAASRISNQSFLAVIDSSGAFFHWKLKFRLAVGIRFPLSRGHGAFRYLPIGLSDSPGTHDSFTKNIFLKMHQEGGMVTDFVSDSLGCARSDEEAWDAFTSAVIFFLT